MARLKDMFCTARKDLSVRPFWLSSEVWDTLKQYWESPEFKKISEQAKINRASDVDGLGPSLHTCGCIPMSEHKRRLVRFLFKSFELFYGWLHYGLMCKMDNTKFAHASDLMDLCFFICIF